MHDAAINDKVNYLKMLLNHPQQIDIYIKEYEVNIIESYDMKCELAVMCVSVSISIYVCLCYIIV